MLSFAGGRLTFLKKGSASADFGGCVWIHANKSKLYHTEKQGFGYPGLRKKKHDKSICSFLTCSVCLLMMGSKCAQALKIEF